MPSRYVILAVTAALVGGLAACESPRPVAASRPADVRSAGSVDYQQRDIERRIEQAYSSGQLTPDEYRSLRAQADGIRRDERRYMQDYDLSSSEKRDLNARLENLSREVDRLSSNAPRR